MKLSVVSIERNLVQVEAEGEITMRDFRADGPDPFDTLLGAGWASHKVLLNFARVGFVDSSAIGWLMTCRRAFDRAGGLLLVHSIQPRVRQVLDLLRVGKTLPLLSDERAALAAAAAFAAPASSAPAYPVPAPIPVFALAPAPAIVPAPVPIPVQETLPDNGPIALAPAKPRARARKRKVA